MSPDPFEPFNIWEPITHSVSVDGGPVARGFEAPAGWTVYRCPEEQANG
jgi:hypothetical protein